MSARIAQQQSVSRVDDVRRSQTVMDKSRRFTNRLGEIGRKRDDVVIGRFLDFVDAFD